MTHITPLLRFLRALDADQKVQFAAACGTTYNYLYQLAAQHEPNPRLRTAKAMVEESRKYARKAMTPPLTYDDLLVGAPRPDAS